MKSNKSFAKRIRVTKKGKLIARNPGQNHYNSKEKNSTQINKRRARTVMMTAHDRARFLPGK